MKKPIDIQILINPSTGPFKGIDFYRAEDPSLFARKYFNSEEEGHKEEVIDSFMEEVASEENPQSLFPHKREIDPIEFRITPEMVVSFIDIVASLPHTRYNFDDRPFRDSYLFLGDPEIFSLILQEETFIPVDRYKETCESLIDGEMGQYRNATLIGARWHTLFTILGEGWNPIVNFNLRRRINTERE